jgi:hypothetical protein
MPGASIGRAFAVVLCVLGVAGIPPALAGHGTQLPPGTLRGPAHRLSQYPTVSLATATQREAAKRLLAAARRSALERRLPRDAAAAGFRTKTARRAPGDRTIHYLHAEHPRYGHDGRYLDASRPEALIYANAPGRPLVLVGEMFSVPRGVHGPTPGGPITRWHTHEVCAHGARRGLTPRADGTCPRGTKRRQGSEMLHLWFTGDLRSAFAIHAPEPELCLAGLLRTEACLHAAHHHVH